MTTIAPTRGKTAEVSPGTPRLTGEGHAGREEARGGDGEAAMDDNMTQGATVPVWIVPFLENLRNTANVRAACKAADVSRNVAYQRRKSDPAFAALWDDALEDACDDLEAEARRRGKDGVDEPVIYQGEMMGVWVKPDGTATKRKTRGAVFKPLTIKKYSDALLMKQLAAHRPDLYGDRVKVLGGGKNGEIILARLGPGQSTDDL